MRWSGHQLHADIDLDIAPDNTAADAHDLAHDVEQRLITAIPKLSEVVAHAYPAATQRSSA